MRNQRPRHRGSARPRPVGRRGSRRPRPGTLPAPGAAVGWHPRVTAWHGVIALAGVLVLVLIGWAVVRSTMAAFTDQGELRSDYSAAFSIGVVDPEETVHLPEGDSITGTAEEIQGFVPGSTAEIPVEVFNNSPAGAAEMTTAVRADSDLAGLFRYSAASVSGDRSTVLFGDPEDPAQGVTADQIPPALEMSLAPRGSDPLEAGQTWTGSAESRAQIVLFAHLLDNEESSAASSVHTNLTITMQGKTP